MPPEASNPNISCLANGHHPLMTPNVQWIPQRIPKFDDNLKFIILSKNHLQQIVERNSDDMKWQYDWKVLITHTWAQSRSPHWCCRSLRRSPPARRPDQDRPPATKASWPNFSLIVGSGRMIWLFRRYDYLANLEIGKREDQRVQARRTDWQCSKQGSPLRSFCFNRQH